MYYMVVVILTNNWIVNDIKLFLATAK